jgi:membrane associated rhomboid family serine protease
MPALQRGPVTDTIVVVTCLAWLLELVFGLSGILPYIGGFIPALYATGATAALLPVSPEWAAWQVPSSLTPLTATLLHGGFFHLLSNMLMLLYCGRTVERVLGGGAVLFLYVVGAYAAASAHYFANVNQIVPMVGASGAISGVVGAYAMLFSRSRAKRFGPIPAHYVHALWLAAAWAAVNWMLGFAVSSAGQSIAVAAHIGGFLAGLLFARSLLFWRYRHA